MQRGHRCGPDVPAASVKHTLMQNAVLQRSATAAPTFAIAYRRSGLLPAIWASLAITALAPAVSNAVASSLLVAATG